MKGMICRGEVVTTLAALTSEEGPRSDYRRSGRKNRS